MMTYVNFFDVDKIYLFHGHNMFGCRSVGMIETSKIIGTMYA